jgi:hypothetical protein
MFRRSLSHWALGVVAAGALIVAALAGAKSSQSGIRYASRVVVIDRGTVKANLIGISRDDTFKFKRAAGALSKLGKGSVMLLQGADALLVKKIEHQHGQLLVHTAFATLPQVVRSGHVTSSGSPNFTKAFPANPGAEARGAAASGRAPADDEFVAPGYPYVDAPPRARLASGPSFTVQGANGKYGYILTFSPASPSRMNFSGTLCFERGSVCSAGPSNGLSAEMNISGYIDMQSVDSGFTIDGGRVAGARLTMNHFAAEAKYTYTVAHGSGSSDDPDPPVFHLPLAVDMPVEVGLPVPLYLKLEGSLLLKMGLTSKNSVARGGADFTTDGTRSGAQTKDKTVTVFENGQRAEGQVYDRETGAGGSISAAPAAVVVALSFPKFSIGLGVRTTNAVIYFDLINSIGQEVGAAFGGQFCSAYDWYYSVGMGVAAQIGPWGASSPRKIIYPANGDQGHKHLAEPGC